MIFSVVYTIKIHMIFLNDVLKPNVDKKRMKELFTFLTDGMNLHLRSLKITLFGTKQSAEMQPSFGKSFSWWS